MGIRKTYTSPFSKPLQCSVHTEAKTEEIPQSIPDMELDIDDQKFDRKNEDDQLFEHYFQRVKKCYFWIQADYLNDLQKIQMAIRIAEF